MANNLKILSNPEKFKQKEQLYLSLRKKEGRFYTDDFLAKIPYQGNSHPLAKEWKVRASSAESMCQYLLDKSKALNLLDLGCGNGWLANFVSKTGAEITAMDLNLEELKMGARVFSANEKVQFIYGDVFEDILPEQYFDIVMCASSIQYFVDLKVLIERLFRFLKPGGEIHIIDSPVYQENETEQAKKRSLRYFSEAGFSDMIKYYYHHSWNELTGFNYTLRKGPKLRKLMAKLSGMPNFPWIIIHKD